MVCKFAHYWNCATKKHIFSTTTGNSASRRQIFKKILFFYTINPAFMKWIFLTNKLPLFCCHMYILRIYCWINATTSVGWQAGWMTSNVLIGQVVDRPAKPKKMCFKTRQIIVCYEKSRPHMHPQSLLNLCVYTGHFHGY